LGFPIVPIELVYPEFGRNLLPEILKRGRNQDGACLLIYGIVTLGDPLERSTINLKGPIVVNPEQRIGRQVIMTSEECPTDYPIVQV
jgi:flagellar assembly factor FliW